MQHTCSYEERKQKLAYILIKEEYLFANCSFAVANVFSSGNDK